MRVLPNKNLPFMYLIRYKTSLLLIKIVISFKHRTITILHQESSILCEKGDDDQIFTESLCVS